MLKPHSRLFDAAGDAGSGGGGSGNGTLLSQAGGDGSAAAGGPGQGQQGQGGDAGTSPAYFRGLYGEDGKINKAAWDRLPDHLKPAAESLKKYDTIDALLGATWHSFQMNGKKGLMPLPENATPEAKTEFNNRLREILKVPKTKEEYGVKKPEGVPDEQWDGEYVNSMLDVLHKHNASPELVRELVEADSKAATGKVSAHMERLRAQQQADFAALSKELGADAPRKFARAKMAAISLGLNPDEPGVGDNVSIIRALIRHSDLVSEDHVTGGEGAAASKGPAETAQSIIFDKAHPDHEAYHKSAHPRHKAVVDRVKELNRQGAERAKAKK